MKIKRIISGLMSFVMIFMLIVYSPQTTFAENSTLQGAEEAWQENSEAESEAADSLEDIVSDHTGTQKDEQTELETENGQEEDNLSPEDSLEGAVEEENSGKELSPSEETSVSDQTSQEFAESTEENTDQSGVTESSSSSEESSQEAGIDQEESAENTEETEESSSSAEPSEESSEAESLPEMEESSSAEEEENVALPEESTESEESTEAGETAETEEGTAGGMVPIASDSNASGGGSGSAGGSNNNIINNESSLLTAEEIAEMSFAELYQYLQTLETEQEKENVLKLLSEEDYLEFMDYITMMEFVDPVNFTNAGPLFLLSRVRAQLKAISFLQKNTENPDGLVLTKEFIPAEGADDGSGTLHLEAYTTGQVTSTEASIPLDIVLVLDQSGSMGDRFGSNRVTKQSALKDSVTGFIESVAEDAVTKNVEHRIAIVTYDSNAFEKIGLTSVRSEEERLLNIIDRLPTKPSGATNTGAGMEQAVDILENSENDSVVILFTDGVPTTQSAFSDSVANTAIRAAKKLKDQGTTVYSVGIFSGANPEVLWGDDARNDRAPGSVGYQWNASNEDESIKANRFMNFVSSNVPDAEKLGLKSITGWFFRIVAYEITQAYEKEHTDYYLTANDEESLDEIFQSISEEIGQANIELGSEAYLQDVISPYFMLPENVSTSDIKVWTDDCTGKTGDDFVFKNDPVSFDDAEIVISGKIVQVKNFNYDIYYVRDEEYNGTYGKKLIVEIPIVVDYDTTGTFGGNGFPTNLEEGQSGIFNNDGVVGEFDSPDANIPVRYAFSTTDKSVYLSNSVTDLSELIQTIDEFNPGEEAGDEKNNSRVTIQYMISNGEETATLTVDPGESLAEGTIEGSLESLIGLKENTTIKISCKIYAVDDPSNKKDLGDQEAQVYVFCPVIGFKDSQIYLGETADYVNDNMINAIQWSYSGEGSEVPPVEGIEPEVNILGFEPSADYFDEDTYVSVNKVKVGELEFDLNEQSEQNYISFTHEDCSLIENCPFDPEKGQFIVHVKPCSLTITKEVDDSEDKDQVFLFTVTGPKGEKWQISIIGSGSKTLTGLPIGEYTVTEDVEWSWRYTCNDPTKSAMLGKDNPRGSVIIINSLSETKWLSDEVQADNIFGEILPVGENEIALMGKEDKDEF